MSLSLNELQILQKKRLPPRSVIIPASVGGLDYRTKHSSDRIEMLGGRWSVMYDGFSFDGEQISYAEGAAPSSAVFPGFLDQTRMYAQSVCLKRRVVLPRNAGEGRVLLHAEGLVGSVCVYCNGQSVGASADGVYAAEFDLTPNIDIHAENEIAFVFLCEKAPAARCGIVDDIYLIYQSTEGLWDYEVRTKADGIDVRLQPYSGKRGLRAEVTFDRRVRKADLFAETAVSFTLPSPEGWNAERVYTYDLVITVLSGDTVIEVHKKKIGLRTCVVEDGMICLNETPIVFRGVTYQPYSAAAGMFRSGKEIGEDLRLIRSCHFNALALNGPLSPAVYEYCTEMGLYVMQGTAAADTLTDTADAEVYAEQAYARTKNETCVLLRSAAFAPPELAVCRAYYQNQISAVPFLASVDREASAAYNSALSDIRAVVYPKQGVLQEMMQAESDVPTMVCAYRTESSTDEMTLSAICEMMDTYPQLQGAFLDGFFAVCCQWDGTSEPIMQTLKYWMNPLGISDTGEGLSVYCRHNFERLDNCTMIWNLTEDGKPIGDGIVTGLGFGPGEIKKISYPTSLDDTVVGAQYLLNVMLFCGEKDLGYAQALLHTSKAPSWTAPVGQVSAEEHDGTLVLLSDTAEVTVRDGCLYSCKRDGHRLLSTPMTLVVLENGVPISTNVSIRKTSVTHTDFAAVFSCRVVLETERAVPEMDLRYTLYTDGVLHISAECMMENTPDITFGLCLDGAADGAELGWYGLGWKASTKGVRDGSLIGRYSAAVSELGDPLSAVLPLRRKTRYLACDTANGHVLLCTDQTFSFGVRDEKIYLLPDDGNALSVAVTPYVSDEDARARIRASYDAFCP